MDGLFTDIINCFLVLVSQLMITYIPFAYWLITMLTELLDVLEVKQGIIVVIITIVIVIIVIVINVTIIPPPHPPPLFSLYNFVDFPRCEGRIHCIMHI